MGLNAVVRAPWFEKLFVPLVAIVAAIAGGAVSCQATTSATNATLAAQQDRDRAAIRGELYQDYIDAANEYYLESADASEAIADIPDSKLNADLPEVQSWLSARHDFQGEINRMYIQASDEALDLARDLAAFMPPSVGGPDQGDLEELKAFSTTPLFTEAYSGFLDQTCLEIRVDDDQSCGDRR